MYFYFKLDSGDPAKFRQWSVSNHARRELTKMGGRRWGDVAGAQRSGPSRSPGRGRGIPGRLESNARDQEPGPPCESPHWGPRGGRDEWTGRPPCAPRVPQPLPGPGPGPRGPLLRRDVQDEEDPGAGCCKQEQQPEEPAAREPHAAPARGRPVRCPEPRKEARVDRSRLVQAAALLCPAPPCPPGAAIAPPRPATPPPLHLCPGQATGDLRTLGDRNTAPLPAAARAPPGTLLQPLSPLGTPATGLGLSSALSPHGQGRAVPFSFPPPTQERSMFCTSSAVFWWRRRGVVIPPLWL
jgi:hypothetical protein